MILYRTRQDILGKECGFGLNYRQHHLLSRLVNLTRFGDARSRIGRKHSHLR